MPRVDLGLTSERSTRHAVTLPAVDPRPGGHAAGTRQGQRYSVTWVRLHESVVPPALPEQKEIVMAHREILSAARADVASRASSGGETDERALVGAFVPLFLGEINDDYFAPFGAELAAWALSELRFGRVRAAGETLVEVDTSADGADAVVRVITDDAPFLVDTIRLVLERRDVPTSFVVHPMIDVERDAAGAIVGFSGAGSGGSGVREAWTLIEIARCSAAEAASLEHDVRAAVADVHRVVGDFDAIRERATVLADELADAPAEGHTATEGEQVSKLLGWLTRQHFVFLGAASYELAGGALSVVPGSQLGILRTTTDVDPPYAGGVELVSIARTDDEVEIHRRARPVCIAVRRFSDGGDVVGEERFVGLFSAAAYRASVTTIPLIRERVAWITSKSRLDPNSHSGRALRTVLETFPRDEMFELGRDELADVANAIVGLQERTVVRVLELRAPASGWQTLAVYLPRTRVAADTPLRIADHVASATRSDRMEFDTFIGTSPLARITVEIRRSRPVTAEELARLGSDVDLMTQRWDDQVRAALIAAIEPVEATRLADEYVAQLPADYRSLTTPALAVVDLPIIDRLLAGDEVTATTFVPSDDAVEGVHRFRIYRRNQPLTLAELLPLLDQLGMQAIDEQPFVLQIGRRDTVSLYDIGVRFAVEGAVPEASLREAESTFRQLLAGTIEADGFNRLVLAAGLNARDVEIIRAYAKYVRQTSFPFSQPYVESTVAKHPDVMRLLAQLFRTRFDVTMPADQRKDLCDVIVVDLNTALEAIPSLDEDRICRTLGDVILATVRTNAFRPGVDGAKRDVLAFKLDPQLVPDLPLPKPMFEIWVCSPRVEGVHLRGGRIARGGIRWSDRREDFRTEVLGLMKAQMVKNAVIVPVGSKGGFVVKRPPTIGPRGSVIDTGDALRQEVVACYRDFIAGLLDLTDNLVAGGVVPPPDTVRYDTDDPYLVVAADKGTATFSDIANGISADYGYWLGDAFASGGSDGYDHKVMGITARGAWESVRRHAQVLGRNADRDPLTVVGIGDMSGDVFGNGLLRSEHVKLLAAFDHRHIFLDPNPDPAASFAERARLFALPRSSWRDYDPALISEGGGVYPRTVKSIALSAPIRQRLGITDSELAPNELISAILRAPVDLLWNGGIGTYVKAATETNADVGDRTNDAVRVNGAELRCRIVGEGGNLGLTQRGRVEYALAGGLINTDAIDNSAGVDCSDHEVNIKILLNGCVQRGEMTVEERNEFLASMTNEVGELVLDDNRAQTMALTIARKQAFSMINVHTRYLHTLESEGWLNRALEFLPTDRQLAERQAAGQGLTTPEFSVLLAYTKNANVAEVLESDLPDDPYLHAELVRYFPKPMQVRFPEQISSHQLRREITTTQIINQMVNLSGISFDHRITEQSGASVTDIARAWITARDIFGLPTLWDEIEALGSDVKLDVQLDLLLEARRMVERGVLWLLRRRRPPIDIESTVREFAGPMRVLSTRYDDVLRGQLGAITHSTWASRLAAGVHESLAERSSVWPLLHTAFDVIDISGRFQTDLVIVAGTYWHLFDALDVLWLWDGVGALPRSTRWETQARSALRDDLLIGLADLTEDVLRSGGDVAAWMAANERAVGRLTAMFNDVRRGDNFDITTLTVGLRQLRNLSLSTN
ncbi:MAG: NAD-specific glutamate dehydrogenase [Ilumatobacteraceae bacterium]|nr:NAD-specific glutamate dehydrogenase [Ilumatobacteraceae bacterium]